MDAGDLIAIGAALISVGSLFFAVRSARSADRSARAAERSADADHGLLELETRGRAQADLDRRLDIWHVDHVDEGTWFIRLDAPAAYRWEVDAHGSYVRVSRRGGASGPMFRGDTLTIETTLAVWSRRITIIWAESDEPGSELLRKPMVL
jgi:hypothetical protein